MKSIIKMLFYLSIIIILGCVSTVNIEQINEFYNSGNEKAMESILDNLCKIFMKASFKLMLMFMRILSEEELGKLMIASGGI